MFSHFHWSYLPAQAAVTRQSMDVRDYVIKLFQLLINCDLIVLFFKVNKDVSDLNFTVTVQYLYHNNHSILNAL